MILACVSFITSQRMNVPHDIDFWKTNEENLVLLELILTKVYYKDGYLFRTYRLHQQRTFEIEQICLRDYGYFYRKYSCCYYALEM